MKTLKELFYRLENEKEFLKRYPEYQPNDKKIHILYASTYLNESAYYRTILPALELNRTNTHAAIIVNFHKWDFNKFYDDYDSPVDFRLVKWADYVVLPAMFTDVDYIIKSMRDINPEIEFVMDIDLIYHELPALHPEAKKYTPERLNTLVMNLFKVDIFTSPNKSVRSYYEQLVHGRQEDFLLYCDTNRILLSNITYQEIPELFANPTDKVRIGVMVDPAQPKDLKQMETFFQSLLTGFGQEINLVLYGVSAKGATENGLLNDKRISYEPIVPFHKHHQRLNELCFDIGILPMVDNPYNRSGLLFNRFLDLSANMVPVIAPKLPPFETLISDGKNGYLAATEQDWLDKTSLLIKDKELRTNVGNLAFKIVWENHSYTPVSINELRNIFA